MVIMKFDKQLMQLNSKHDLALSSDVDGVGFDLLVEI